MSSSTPKQVIYENLAEIAKAMGHVHRLELLELMARLKDGMVTLLDVSSPGEFALGHIPGALNMPVEELERRLAQLPKDQEIVAYCRGTYCVLSNDAVAALRAKGYRIRRLEDGFPEWKAAGLVVATA